MNTDFRYAHPWPQDHDIIHLTGVDGQFQEQWNQNHSKMGRLNFPNETATHVSSSIVSFQTQSGDVIYMELFCPHVFTCLWTCKIQQELEPGLTSRASMQQDKKHTISLNRLAQIYKVSSRRKWWGKIKFRTYFTCASMFIRALLRFTAVKSADSLHSICSSDFVILCSSLEAPGDLWWDHGSFLAQGMATFSSSALRLTRPNVSTSKPWKYIC